MPSSTHRILPAIPFDALLSRDAAIAEAADIADRNIFGVGFAWQEGHRWYAGEACPPRVGLVGEVIEIDRSRVQVTPLVGLKGF